MNAALLQDAYILYIRVRVTVPVPTRRDTKVTVRSYESYDNMYGITLVAVTTVVFGRVYSFILKSFIDSPINIYKYITLSMIFHILYSYAGYSV